MANSETRSRGAAEDSNAFPPRDRDQAPESAARAENKAEQAEAAATRPLGGTDATGGDPLASRDNLQGSNADGAKGPTGGPAAAAGEQSEERRRRIAERAYYRAERRGFSPGGEDGDWLDAEKEIDGPSK
jgi:hypothetical protein